MNISFIQALNYLNVVNSNIIALCDSKNEKIIQYLLFCNVIRSLEEKMANSEYITIEELKSEFLSKLSSSSEHNNIKEALNEDGINSIKEDYQKLTNESKTK